MKIKKLFSIFASIAMVLSLIALPTNVSAEESSDQLTRAADNEPFEKYGFHYDAVKNVLILSVVENEIWFENNTIENVDFYIENYNGDGSRSIAYNEFTLTDDGQMTTIVPFEAIVGKSYYIYGLNVKYNTNDGLTNYCTVDGYDYIFIPYALIPAEINALESTSFNGLVDVVSREKFIFNMTMDETVVPNITLYYRDKNSGKNETTDFINLHYQKKIDENRYEFTYTFGYDEAFKGFENFELVALVLAQSNDEELPSYSPRYYSTADIDLNDGYVDVDGNEVRPFEVNESNYKQIESLKAFNFAVKEYFDENEAPEIDFSTFKWESKSVVTPTSPRYTFNVKEEGCGVQEVYFIFEIQNSDGNKYFAFANRPSNVDYMPGWMVRGSEIEFAGQYNSLTASDLDGTMKVVAARVADNRYNARFYIANGYEEYFAYEDSDYNRDLFDKYEISDFESFSSNDYELDYKSATHIDKKIRYEDYLRYDVDTGECTYDYFMSEFEKIVADDTNDGKTYLICLGYGIDSGEDTIIPDELFKMIQGKNLNVMFETKRPYAIQWIINGLDVQDSYFDKSEDDDGVVNMNPISYVYNSGINIKDEEAYMSLDVQSGILETPIDLSMLDINLKNESLEKYNNAILNCLKNNSYIKLIEDKYNIRSEEVFAYYIEYLEKFDIKTVDYEEMFWKEYNSNLSYKYKFYSNGVLPGEFTIRIQEPNMQQSLEEVDCYYIEKDGSETLVQSGIPLTNSYYDVKISHNSTYELRKSSKEDPVVPPVDPETPPTTDPVIPPVDNGNNEQNTQPTNPGDAVNTSDSLNTYFYLSCMTFALLGIVVSKKRKVNE